jgi:hypothetical protein
MKETPDQCVFFGDKICKDGNDLDIAMKCGKYHNGRWTSGFNSSIYRNTYE